MYVITHITREVNEDRIIDEPFCYYVKLALIIELSTEHFIRQLLFFNYSCINYNKRMSDARIRFVKRIS